MACTVARCITHEFRCRTVSRRATVDTMRSEHKTTADEFDAFTAWRHVFAGMRRAGVRKAFKQRSHRIDRRQQRRRAADAAGSGHSELGFFT
jgi:hypothetical protein